MTVSVSDRYHTFKLLRRQVTQKADLKRPLLLIGPDQVRVIQNFNTAATRRYFRHLQFHAGIWVRDLDDTFLGITTGQFTQVNWDISIHWTRGVVRASGQNVE
ncbi:MAG: hypothetical protein Kow00105_16720 [Phycisphaeraceae bacterium]